MYDFDVATADATNPLGCGIEGHGLACLCDVDLSLTPEPTGALTSLPCTADDFANFMAARLDGFERVHASLREGHTVDSVLYAAERYKVLHGTIGEDNDAMSPLWEARGCLLELLSAGLPLRAVAYLTDAEPVALVTRIMHNKQEFCASKYVELDDLLRQGAFDQYTDLARKLDLGVNQVRTWCKLVGITRGRDEARARLVALYTEGGRTMRQCLAIVNEAFGTSWTVQNGHQLVHRALQAA